jgi:hypothetical protein
MDEQARKPGFVSPGFNEGQGVGRRSPHRGGDPVSAEAESAGGGAGFTVSGPVNPKFSAGR